MELECLCLPIGCHCSIQLSLGVFDVTVNFKYKLVDMVTVNMLFMIHMYSACQLMPCQVKHAM